MLNVDEYLLPEFMHWDQVDADQASSATLRDYHVSND
jgi:hypothetical protein